VLLGHVWAKLVPFGEYAWRTNLLSAVCGSAGAGLWFLVTHEALRGMRERLPEGQARLVRVGGAVSAAVIAAFGFTMWQNSNETEVYAIAVFTVAAVCWLALRWRAHRGTERASRMLLLALYLGGISIGAGRIPVRHAPGRSRRRSG
jgi:dipeptide/tripeptide permease